MRLMASRRLLIKRLAKTFLPVVLIILIAVVAVTVWIVHGITRPPRAAYLVTPQTFSIGPVLTASDVNWPNHDGTQARGWLIRGNEGAPAVILLHRYGADRSSLLNMAVKLNESTGFTVLWPDLRGHGLNPPVERTWLGAIEGDDVTAAIDYLRTLKTQTGQNQVGQIGIYGAELGGYAALDAARLYPEVRALALDSMPESPDAMVGAATTQYTGIGNVLLHKLGSLGMRAYARGKFQNTGSCELGRALKNVKVLLLTGPADDPWRGSTLQLANCFGGNSVEVKKDLPLTGMNLDSATGEQEEAYGRPVIEFFKSALKQTEPVTAGARQTK
jgi:pimeloyl-ACP methyl ester carboxylesterase